MAKFVVKIRCLSYDITDGGAAGGISFAGLE